MVLVVVPAPGAAATSSSTSSIDVLPRGPLLRNQDDSTDDGVDNGTEKDEGENPGRTTPGPPTPSFPNPRHMAEFLETRPLTQILPQKPNKPLRIFVVEVGGVGWGVYTPMTRTVLGGFLGHNNFPPTNTVLISAKLELSWHVLTGSTACMREQILGRPKRSCQAKHRREFSTPGAEKGDVLIFIGGRSYWYEEVLPQVKAHGVYTIYYQSEPMHFVHMHRGRACALNGNEVDELWDFNWLNIQFCGQRSRVLSGSSSSAGPIVAAPKQRYIPGGYILSQEQEKNAGKFISGKEEEATSAGQNRVLFLGTVAGFWDREKCVHKYRKEVFSSAFQHRNDVTSVTQYEHVLSATDIFWNMHKVCCNKVKLSPWKGSMIHANTPPPPPTSPPPPSSPPSPSPFLPPSLPSIPP